MVCTEALIYLSYVANICQSRKLSKRLVLIPVDVPLYPLQLNILNGLNVQFYLIFSSTVCTDRNLRNVQWPHCPITRIMVTLKSTLQTSILSEDCCRYIIKNNCEGSSKSDEKHL